MFNSPPQLQKVRLVNAVNRITQPINWDFVASEVGHYTTSLDCQDQYLFGFSQPVNIQAASTVLENEDSTTNTEVKPLI